MFYIEFKDGKAVNVTDVYPEDGGAFESRWDWHHKDGFETVTKIAKELTEATGRHFIGTDAGSSTAPRYDIVEVPKVGDDVSYAFNGDSYPCGQIKSISDSLRLITTTDGSKFYRVRQTGCWRMNGTWSLVAGVHNERNPHF